MRGLVQHLSYANVMATIAVFIALGGSSYAVSRINGRRLAPRSVAGSKLKRNTVTGREIRESKLGRVQDAAHLRGLGPESFLAAGATAVNAAKLAGLGPESFLRVNATAVNATELGGLNASAYERGAQRFEVEDPSASFGDERSVAVGPFTLAPVCAAGNEGLHISSAEPHAAMGALAGPTATAYSTADLGSGQQYVLTTADNTARVIPFELWAVAPSGYRTVVHGWIGRGVLGRSCVVAGGVAVRG